MRALSLMGGGIHTWNRNGSWGWQCLRCDMQSGTKDPNSLPRGGCK